jgi:hypothetical protein
MNNFAPRPMQDYSLCSKYFRKSMRDVSDGDKEMRELAAMHHCPPSQSNNELLFASSTVYLLGEEDGKKNNCYLHCHDQSCFLRVTFA